MLDRVSESSSENNEESQMILANSRMYKGINTLDGIQRITPHCVVVIVWTDDGSDTWVLESPKAFGDLDRMYRDKAVAENRPYKEPVYQPLRYSPGVIKV